MKAPFRFPLHAGDLEVFCHPHEGHAMSRTHMVDGDLVAANGHLAVRASRGLWLDADFEPAPADFLQRVAGLPWGSAPDHSSEAWRPLDDARGDIYRSATIGLYNNKGRISPSPVWMVAGQHPIRLSFLQQIARLPRCEVYTGALHNSQPAWFRFNGGTVIVPKTKRPFPTFSRQLFPPRPAFL
jgi:hypothetical protein